MYSRYFIAATLIAAWAICSVMIWFVLLAVTHFVCALALPFRIDTSASYRPSSGAYQRIEVDAVSEVLAGDDVAQSAAVTVRLTKSDSTRSSLTVEVHDVDRAAGQILGAAAAPVPLDKQSVLQWLNSSGVDTANTQVIGEAEELILIIHGLAAGPKVGPPSKLQLLTQQTIRSGSRRLLPGAAWVSWLPLVGAVVLWALGSVLILRFTASRVS